VIRSLVLLLLTAGCGRMPSEAPKTAEPAIASAAPIKNPNFGFFGADNRDVFLETPNAVPGEPELVIENADNWPVVFRVEGDQRYAIEVPANETRSIRVPEGRYRYHADVPALATYSADLVAIANIRYAIRISTVWLINDDVGPAGKGFHCAEHQGDAWRFFACTRSAENCSKVRAMNKARFGECANRKAMFRFGHKRLALFAESLADCTQLRDQYLAALLAAKAESELTACEERH